MTKNAARPWGFTLVELLTVIAIIGVLATLISASLANAQRKGRKAVSTSNLRQIAIAFNLYVDDRDKRPETFRQMTEGKYLSERVLICPEDRIVKDWAGALESMDAGRKTNVWVAIPGRGEEGMGQGVGRDVAHSYFKSFDYYDEIWTRIDKQPTGGLAACQLHGIGRQRKDEPPDITDYQGLVLRALKDGSVVSRQVFWAANGFNSSNNPNFGDGTVNAPSTDGPGTASTVSHLPLFVDPTE